MYNWQYERLKKVCSIISYNIEGLNYVEILDIIGFLCNNYGKIEIFYGIINMFYCI